MAYLPMMPWFSISLRTRSVFSRLMECKCTIRPILPRSRYSSQRGFYKPERSERTPYSESRDRGGTVFVSPVTCEYLQIGLWWVGAVRALGLDNFMIIAGDAETRAR